MYCERCQKNNHNTTDCFFNKYCSGCDRKGHTFDECRNRGQQHFGREKNWKYGPVKHINALTSEAGENFSPLVLFNVTTLDHQPIHEVVADTGAGVSAITTKLANEIGVVIEEVSSKRVVSQVDGTEFSFVGIARVGVRIEGEIF